jgi:hypothetical protein
MDNKPPPLRITPLEDVRGKILYGRSSLEKFDNAISAVEDILKDNTNMQNEEYHKMIQTFENKKQLTINKLAKLKKDYKNIKHKQLTTQLDTISKQLDNCLLTHTHIVLPFNDATQTDLSKSRIRQLRDKFIKIESLLRNYTTTTNEGHDAANNSNKSRHVDKKKRELLFETYYPGKTSGPCWCCNSTIITKYALPGKKRVDWDCGHVVSHHSGGLMDLSNMRPICVTCNQGMKTRHMFLYKATLFV